MYSFTKTIAAATLAAAVSYPIMANENNIINSDNDSFQYVTDRFADIEVLRYRVPGFEDLTINQKKLIYYLTEAAIWGRDILWDQNGKYNLAIRNLIEDVYSNYSGEKSDPEYKHLEKYLKQIWFGNGIHHHYSMDKFTPGFSREFLMNQIKQLPGNNKHNDIEILLDVIFNPQTLSKRVNQTEGQDLIITSANNLYEGVTQAEVEEYYNNKKDTTNLTPISYGLNTKVSKIDGNIVELPYKLNGLYSSAIAKIIENLTMAAQYAENDAQRDVIRTLVDYYITGDLSIFDEYSIKWTEDTASQVDFINGFIESYGDPLGMTGAWESIVNFKNNEASHRTEIISQNAQWFEDHSPVDPRFRKEKVKGVSAKVITDRKSDGEGKSVG